MATEKQFHCWNKNLYILQENPLSNDPISIKFFLSFFLL